MEDSTLLVQVAELLSGGGVSRALVNKTITVDVPLVSMQENSKCRQLTGMLLCLSKVLPLDTVLPNFQ